MLITKDTKNRTPNLELGGGLESVDGGDCEIGIEELEKQASAKMWQNTLRSTARSSNRCEKSFKKVQAGPRHIP